MWPFECREISTFHEVWTLVIPFLEWNSKIGLRQAADQVPYCQYQPSVLSSTRKWRRRYTWKCAFMGNCRKFKWSVILTFSFHMWINMWVAGKTVWSLVNTCHTWATQRWASHDEGAIQVYGYSTDGVCKTCVDQWYLKGMSDLWCIKRQNVKLQRFTWNAFN